MFSPEKGKQREEGAGLFSLETHNSACGNVTKLQQRRLSLAVRKHLSIVRMVKLWNRFPSDVVEIPCLSVFKRHLDNASSND